MARRLLNVLNDQQVQLIDKAVLRILSEIGLQVGSDKVREVFVKAGCSCEGQQVRFDSALIRQCLSSVPSSFEIQGLEPAGRVRIGDQKTHIQPMVGRINILDHDGKKRRTNLGDVANIVTICDRLEHYDILHGGAVMPQIAGVPDNLAHVAGFVQTLRRTGKPFKGSCRGDEVAQDCVNLAKAVEQATGQSFTLHTTCNLVSPLQMASEMVEGALHYIANGWPVDFASEPQIGATSPITLVGTVAQGMAESLAGVVLAQLVNPGTPVLAGTVAAAMDMRYATIALGGVEAALVNAAHAQMADYYGIPSRGTGSNTNAKQLDFQAGYEKMLTLVLPVLAGIDLLFYPGTLEHAETISLESLVLDHDLCAIALHCQKELRVSDDLLAVDLVQQVGPGGAFLGLPQTAREMFNELLMGGSWDRRRRSDWEADGSPRPQDVARKQVEEILAKPRPSLPENIEGALAKVVEDIAKIRGSASFIDELWPN